MIQNLLKKVRDWDEAYFYWSKGQSPYHKALIRFVGKSLIVSAGIFLAVAIYQEEVNRAAERSDAPDPDASPSVVERISQRLSGSRKLQ